MPASLGRYRILRRVAVGGMAEVFLGVDSAAGTKRRPVAIKRLLPQLVQDQELVSMFLEEGRLLQQFDHPGIVRALEVGKSRKSYYMVMEWIPGVSLDRLLARGLEREGEFPLDMLAVISAEACSALDYIHNFRSTDGKPLSLVHRDVSPQNIMLTGAGEVKLLDFGVAKDMGEQSRTRPATLAGKAAYMSPEQVCQDPSLDARTDLFSLGAVMFEMATGRRPFPAPSEVDVIIAIAKQTVPDPRGLDPRIPDPFAEIILKAMAKEPDGRYESASRMKADLQSFIGQRRTPVDRPMLAGFVHQLFPRKASDPTQARQPGEEGGDDWVVTSIPDLLAELGDVPGKDPEQDLEFFAVTAVLPPETGAATTPADSGTPAGQEDTGTEEPLVPSDTEHEAAAVPIQAEPLLGPGGPPGVPVGRTRPLVWLVSLILLVGVGAAAGFVLLEWRPEASSGLSGTAPSAPGPRDRAEDSLSDSVHPSSPTNGDDPNELGDDDVELALVPVPQFEAPSEIRSPSQQRPFDKPMERPPREPAFGIPKEPDDLPEEVDLIPEQEKEATGIATGLPLGEPSDEVPGLSNEPTADEQTEVATADSPEPTDVATKTPPPIKPTFQAPAVIAKRRIAGHDPHYPTVARKAKMRATLLVKIFIEPDGRVGYHKFLKSHPAFEDSVDEAIASWRFRPYTINGRPVGTYTVYKFVFQVD